MLVSGTVMIAMAAHSAAQEDQLPFNQRPADAQVIMSTSRGMYDGSYALSEVARVCGEVPPELNFAGVPAFIVHLYPDSGQGQVNDITFDSKELVGGVTTSETFFLSVAVQSPAIGQPSAYVLDTSMPDMSGRAELTYPEPGTLRLEIDGVNDRGETVQLQLTCLPRT
jgi:hypothetical protein